MNALPTPCRFRFLRAAAAAATAAITALAASSVAHAGVFYSESVSGDLPGDFANPFAGGNLSLGINSISGSSVGTDRDYITFTIPAGLAVTSLTLSSFVSEDDRIFLALTAGNASIDPDTAAANLGGMLGYTHPGTANTTALLGTDILDDLAEGFQAAGFTTPLTPGDYTLWIQETGPINADYGFELTAVPEPSNIAWVVGTLLAGGAAYRHLPRRRR